MKKTRSTTRELKELINNIETHPEAKKTKFWVRIVKELKKPARQRRKVNLHKINKHTREQETAVIPGKVLSAGDLTKEITVAAYQFSKKAREKISSKGKVITLQQLLKENSKAKKVRIIG
ncbi:MAG: 50S ribosomal protein L18e [Nanoarchaeota archaeon]|nr:50S ribosomal protein L18e [Nanoarchaeota archaeon]